MKGIVLNKSDKGCTIQFEGENIPFTYGEKVKPSYVKLGACEFSASDGVISFIKKEDFVNEDYENKDNDSKEKSEGWQDEMVNFKDLLSDAHEKFKGKFNIKTELISMDYEKKQALFSACVSVEDGSEVNLFTGHGDAEGIKSIMIKPHFIRMAETRAIARALRWATNNATCSEEEK